ncbi:hypothetical protein KALB_4855 [Kutzneria albida DSM 43870]|uniref:Uncharacterized protein n=2 Tax=Kutzneria TaxID=43356 RepID=W5WBI4_9PSEU|nr:hypothetical protein KALB_4855 [Kutzneria albida DSM 43870]
MLDEATNEYAELDEAWVRAKAAHRVAYARSFLTTEGSVGFREQTAVLKVEDEWFAMEIADQKVRACKERIRTIRDQIEVGRSLSSAIKAEFAAGAVGQP